MLFDQCMIRILDPCTVSWWDEFASRDPSANFFHCAAWARTISGTYGYKPRYFVSEGQSGWCVVPVMEIRSILTGRRGVGLPFSDTVATLGDGGAVLMETIDALKNFAARRHWRSIELRDSLRKPGFNSSVRFVHHVIKLSLGAEIVEKSLHDSIRRSIRKGERSGVTVVCSRTLEAMEGFYRLHCLTRKRHGLPPPPLDFFRNLWQEAILPGHGFVTCAWLRERMIAAAVFLQFGTTAIYKYGASLDGYHVLRANHLVMWRAIERCMLDGYNSLSLGRTDIGQAGLIRYKKGWGAEERILPYSRSGAPERHSTLKTMASNLLSSAVRRTPITVLRILGEAGYRHAG
jgi:hypothetical protein